jgi:hypothetical protein
MEFPQYNHPVDIWRIFDYLSYKETGTADNYIRYHNKYVGQNESITRMSPEDRFTFYLLICEFENI